MKQRGKEFEFSKFKSQNYIFLDFRCFSAIGLYITKLRTRLGSGTIEDLFILRGHFLEIAAEKTKNKTKKKKKTTRNK